MTTLKQLAKQILITSIIAMTPAMTYAGNVDSTSRGGDTYTVIHDLDQNGRDDILLVNRQTGKNVGAFAQSDGSFFSRSCDGNGDMIYEPQTLKTFDQAVSLRWLGRRHLFFWRQDGQNRFATNPVSPTCRFHSENNFRNNSIPSGWINGFTHVLVGDFIPGGDQELMFYTVGSGDNRLVYRKDGDLAFKQYIDHRAINGYVQIQTADLNGDGLTDLFLWTPGSGVNRIVYTSGSGNHSLSQALSASLINGSYNRVINVKGLDGSDRDSLLFWNLASGDNRRVDIASGVHFVTNFVPKTMFNGYNVMGTGALGGFELVGVNTGEIRLYQTRSQDRQTSSFNDRHLQQPRIVTSRHRFDGGISRACSLYFDLQNVGGTLPFELPHRFDGNRIKVNIRYEASTSDRRNGRYFRTAVLEGQAPTTVRLDFPETRYPGTSTVYLPRSVTLTGRILVPDTGEVIATFQTRQNVGNCEHNANPF